MEAVRRLADELLCATLETEGQAIFAEAMEGKETKTCTSNVRKAAKCVGHITVSSGCCLTETFLVFTVEFFSLN